MQNFHSVKHFFIYPSWKQTSVFLEKTLLKGKGLSEDREQDSCGWNMPQLNSSLLDELILLPSKPAVRHV